MDVSKWNHRTALNHNTRMMHLELIRNTFIQSVLPMTETDSLNMTMKLKRAIKVIVFMIK